MAWPQTRLRDFVDASTPYVDAQYLNEVQDETIALRRIAGNQRAGGGGATVPLTGCFFEDWNAEPAVDYGDTVPLASGRWTGVGTAGGIARTTDPQAAFPWSHLQLMSPVGATGVGGIRSAARPWRVGVISGRATYLETVVQRSNLGSVGTDKAFHFGLASTPVVAGGPPVAPAVYALFQFYVGGGAPPFWQCHSSDGAGVQSTVTSVALLSSTTARHTLRVEADIAAVRFYINGDLSATHATEIVNGSPLGLTASAFQVIDAGTQHVVRLGPVAMGEFLY